MANVMNRWVSQNIVIKCRAAAHAKTASPLPTFFNVLFFPMQLML